MPIDPISRKPIAPPRSPDWLVLLIAFGVAAVALLIYAPASNNGFVMFDDDINIYNNGMLGSPTWARAQWAFADTFYMPRYMPLGWLSLMTIFAFGGLEPSAYHWVNIVLHGANTALVFLVAVKALELVDRARRRSVTKSWRLGMALLAAISWSLHPLRVEPVSWATGLHYVHATFWGLITTWLLLKRLDQNRRTRHRYFAAAWIAYLFSVLVYPVTLGLPLALFLFELWLKRMREPSADHQPQPEGTYLCREYFSFFALSAFTVCANIWVRIRVPSFFNESPSIEAFPVIQRLLQATYSAVYYALRPLVPGEPTPVYISQFVNGGHRTIAWVCMGAVTLLLIILATTWRRSPGFAAWCLGFAAIGVSYYGLLDSPFQTSDRYTYFTSIVLALGGAMLAQQIPSGHLRKVMTVTAIIWCGWLVAAVPKQLSVWRDDTHLFTHIAKYLNRPEAALYEGSLAMRKTRQGDRGAATAKLEELRAAGAPEYVLLQISRQIAAIEAASSQIKLKLRPPRGWVAPDALVAYVNALAARNDSDTWTARVRFTQALRIDPGFHDARYNFALWLAGHGETEAAWDHYQVLNKARPDGLAGNMENTLLQVIAESARIIGNETLFQKSSEKLIPMNTPNGAQYSTPVGRL